MAYLILENDETKRTDSCGYIDFNPENGNDINSVTDILTSRRDGSGQNQTVTLLSASGEETENGLGRLLATVLALFRGESACMPRNIRTHAPKSCKNPKNCRRINRSTNGFSVA